MPIQVRGTGFQMSVSHKGQRTRTSSEFLRDGGIIARGLKSRGVKLVPVP